ncbi:MAG: S8 family serine peptidase [Tatlockia sp.]|nr:S8 family serine peptidase [Tatlockia sp.]
MRYQAALTGFMLFALTQVGVAADEDSVRIIVKYKPRITLASLTTQIKGAVNLPLTSLKPMAGSAYLLTFETKSSNLAGNKTPNLTASILRQLRNNPNLVYALNDRKGYFHPLPNIKFNDNSVLLAHESQWNEFSPPAGIMLESVAGLEDGAWAYTKGQAIQPIVVAVLDTGISLNPDLVNSLVKDEQNKIWGWNFSANNADVLDETNSYHGTHVAGTIAGYGAIMLGVSGHLKILPVKIPDSKGMFYESQVINALYWSVGGDVPGLPKNPYPAKVLNMSFGIDEDGEKEIDHCDLALQEALHFVRQKGAVITAAAGNDNHWESYSAPAVCNDAIKVAATGPTGLRAFYSNYGPSISFAAPGGDQFYGTQGGILSTVNPGGGYLNSGFNFYQGTSMASPHAAGVAGLIYAVSKGTLNPERVEQILYATTHAFGQSEDANNSCVGSKPCGSGILDANNAVKAAIADYDEIITVPVLSSQIRSKSQWLLIKISAKQKANFTNPQLSKTKDGKLIVNYGAVIYSFDDSEFKHCQIIGLRGIGCYR